MKMTELKPGMAVDMVKHDCIGTVVDTNCTFNEESGHVFGSKMVLVRYRGAFGMLAREYVHPRNLAPAPGFTKATS